MVRLNAVQETMGTIKAGYSAAQPSRFNRVRAGLGGTADAHMAAGLSYWRVREYCRDMDRNDVLIGQMLDRACDNIVGNPQPIPSTGDKAIDARIIEKFKTWSKDKTLCDESKRHTFSNMAWLNMRHTLADGDCFALPVAGPKLQLIEGDWVSTPHGRREGIVHGVEIDDVGAPTRYWFSQPTSKTWDRIGNIFSAKAHESRPAFAPTGEPLVYHMYKLRRSSQHRGMPALTPVLETAGMFEDLNYAKLVQQQISACVGAFIERQQDFSFGARRKQSDGSGGSETLEKVSPGMLVRLKPGEKISSFAPNVTPQQWFEHIRLLVRLISVNVGLPLSLALLDTSETNFHGYRGEMEQAKIGFRKRQDLLEEQFYAPVYRFLVGTWAAEERWNVDLATLFNHRWSRPAWPYVNPLVDAQADAFQLENLLVSPRDIQAERGRDWEETVRETVEDRAMSIQMASQKAKELSDLLGIEVTWREVLNLKTTQGTSITQTTSRQVIEETL